jgi:hypothetical protein
VAALQDRQLELIERMAALDPRPWFMGGWAEDAVLAGEATRPHVDLDWLLRRSELDERLAQAARFGFQSFETWGESAPGEPFYLYGESGELKLDLGVADEDAGRLVLRIHKLFFDVDGREPTAGYQVRLPDDTFDHPPVELHGIEIRTASPLALYRLRAGIARIGSFGPLSEHQQHSMERLRERFFPERTPAELVPQVELLPR